MTKNRPRFPRAKAAKEPVGVATRCFRAKGTMPIQQGSLALNYLATELEGRVPA